MNELKEVVDRFGQQRFEEGVNAGIDKLQVLFNDYVDEYGTGKYDIEMNFNVFYDLCLKAKVGAKNGR